MRSSDSIHRTSYGLRTDLIVGLILLAGLFALPTGAALFTVGNTAQGCTSPTVEAALLGAALTLNGEDDTIRIVSSTATVDAAIVNFDPDTVGSVTIIGGFSSCADTTPSGRSPITGNSVGPVFEVTATGDKESVVTLENLTITGATNHRGIEASGSGADVTIINTRITNHDGGVSVTDGADLDLAINTEVNFNDAGVGAGGGVFCSGVGSTVSIAGLIHNNDASAGAGLSLDGGCVVTLRNGARVFSNDATWGGGVSVNGIGSSLITSPTATAGIGIRIYNNTASLEGGGLWVVNSGAAVLFETWVRDNEADAGGGIFAANSANVTMDRVNSTCALSPCSWLEGNTLTSAGEGSAVYADAGSDVNLYQTHVEGNSGVNQNGFALFATGPDTEIRMEGVQYWNNNTVSLFQAEDQATITVAFVSAARNDYRNPLGVVVDSLGGQANTSGEIHLLSSILWDHQGFGTATGGVITADCLMVADGTGIALGTSLVGVAPLFLNAAAGDLRVSPSSPAIDYCNGVIHSPSQPDLANVARGFDAPGIANVLGPYDLGAYESRGLLFADGFETGDTRAWVTTP